MNKNNEQKIESDNKVYKGRIIQSVSALRSKKDTKHVFLFWKNSFFFNSFFFVFYIVYLRIQGKKVILVSHQYLTDMLSKQGYAAKYLHMLLMLCASKIIVCEEITRDRLSPFGNENKVVVIPHAVSLFRLPSKENARKKLDIPQNRFVLFLFVDSPRAQKKPWLHNLLEELGQEKLPRKIETFSTIDSTPENLLLYLQASDLILFPRVIYKNLDFDISLLFSLEKPFVLFAPISNVLETFDLKKTLKEQKLDASSFIFDKTKDAKRKLIGLIKNSEELKKRSLFSRKMKEKRNWNIILREYKKELF